MYKSLTISIIISLLWVSQLLGQTFSGTLLDKETEQPIPYASIIYGKEKGVITNEDGLFSFTIDRGVQTLDSVYISCMGYVKKGFSPSMLKKPTIYLDPGGFELKGIDLMGQGLSANEIIERMVARVPENYQQMPVKKKFFLRQSTFDEIKESKIKLRASTIPEINDIVIEDMLKKLPEKTAYHTETYGEMYKHEQQVKLKVLKATEMYDKEKQATYHGLNHALQTILKKYVKADSYFKIKTGPVSTKIDLDTIIGRPELTTEDTEISNTSIKNNYLASRQNRLTKIEQQVFGEKSRLEVIEKRKNYLFTKGETIEKDGERFYVISFKPKSKAKLTGKMFINTLDFALIRIEYKNLLPLKHFKLLGIHYNEPLYEGVAEFAKMKNGKYELYFSSLKHNFFIDIKRPIKISEKNKNTQGRRKQNEINLDLYLTAKSVNSFEWVALESKGSSQSSFNMVPQKKLVEVVYLTKYDESYWEGKTIVSPNAAIKAFALNQKPIKP